MKLENRVQPFRIEIKKTILSDGRRFAQCCFFVSDAIIGDFDQYMALGSLELAIGDLIGRMKKLPECDFGFAGGIEAVFEGLSKAFLHGDFWFFQAIEECAQLSDADFNRFSAVPLAVEAFDGEEAYLIKFDGRWRFVWRQWDTKMINSALLDRQFFVDELNSSLNKIGNLSDS